MSDEKNYANSTNMPQTIQNHVDCSMGPQTLPNHADARMQECNARTPPNTMPILDVREMVKNEIQRYLESHGLPELGVNSAQYPPKQEESNTSAYMVSDQTGTTEAITSAWQSPSYTGDPPSGTANQSTTNATSIIQTTITAAPGEINVVHIRWHDSYLEKFECSEVRFGSDLLFMRLIDGENRHVPLRSVRWFSLSKESHARTT